MNVSMGDSFNLGWKLMAVLRGQSDYHLLRSYSEERQDVARDLITFDQEWARIISERSKDSDTPNFQKYFIEHGRYTAGVSVTYKPSTLTGTKDHQGLATGFDIGMRFHSAPVVRLADGKPMSLGHVVKADGRWRLFAFADRAAPSDHDSRLAAFCHYLDSDLESPINRFTNDGDDRDSVFDIRAILQQGFRDSSVPDCPSILRPPKGTHGLIDYEKVFCPDLKAQQDIFDMRGIDRDAGCVVIVRPDQYVAHILPLDATAEISDFFNGIMNPNLSAV